MGRGPSRGRPRPAAIVVIAALALLLASGCTPLTPRPWGPGAGPGTGVYHAVVRGETLWRISRAYGVSVAEIVEANDLSSFTIRPGQKLFIPGAATAKRTKPSVRDDGRPEEPLGRPDAVLAWPLAGRGRGSVTSGFGPRKDPVHGTDSFHKGIDISAAREERVLAAADGEVVFASKMSGFGTVVMIDHGNRTITVYAHLSRAIVDLEHVVERGQPVGYVGTSGRSTGPHLHFEVRYKGVSVDPLEHLP
jgi:murein DD-endopeptidase MepM/ murein hydrolase activator NlpD